ncbi:SCP domain-containing protein [Citrus sinensis]|nr:pathogenesis-related protein 1A [Citrus x clementina]XP_052287716.1 pathogenesis-related protein 1B-like [Citrus sinensis]KAH9655440.1 SCP domain-containing protein [Citrus sinensis]
MSPINSLAIFHLVVLAARIHLSSANNATQQRYVHLHNEARRNVGIGIGMTWDKTLDDHAHSYAQKLKVDCIIEHSVSHYGENLAWADYDFTVDHIVKMWVDEKQFYDYNSNTCAPNQMCGHYTQVVWRKSVRLGCAKERCNNSHQLIAICNYDPPGNAAGERPF